MVTPKPECAEQTRRQRVSVVVGIVCIFALSLFIALPLLSSGRPRPWFDADLSNLHAIAISYQQYAIEHDVLPAHASHVQDDIHIGKWEFVSRHDPNGQVPPTVHDNTPADWYQYGSYHFYPTQGLDPDLISDPSNFLIAYCPAFGNGIDSRDYPAVFLDGHVELISRDDLHRYIANQPKMMIQHPSS